MRRKLSEDEEKATKQGLHKNETELKLLKNQLAYNKAVIEKHKYLDEFERKWKPLLEEANDYENKQAIKKMESDIKITEEKIQIAKEHLIKGVEVKNPIVQ